MIKKLMLLVFAGVALSGCGVSQGQLRDFDQLLTKAQEAPCDEVKAYLNLVQIEVKKKLDK